MPSAPTPTGPARPVPPAGWGLARVRGRSMVPTLSDGDLVVVRWRRPPVLGGVVVVRLPGGRPVSVKRVTARTREGWWVERDSATQGVDSWTVGAVPDADVLGTVVARLWPSPGRLPPPPAAAPSSPPHVSPPGGSPSSG